jgi:hypothetical protein
MALLISSSILLFACSSSQLTKRAGGPQLQISGVEIYNALAHSVNDVIIRVPSTGEYVSCGHILPDSSCSASFPARDYRDTPVQVGWTEKGEPHQTPEFKLEAPAAAIEGEMAYIRVEVFASGQAGARLVLWSSEAN